VRRGPGRRRFPRGLRRSRPGAAPGRARGRRQRGRRGLRRVPR
jgi:hypothetical protein